MSESSQEPPIVECPHCHTRFRVREDQLAAAGGQVRCGACLALFDASHTMAAGSAESAVSDVDEAADSSPASEQSRWRRIALLLIGVTVAVAVLVFQVFAYGFDRWALDPQLRSIYEFGCGVIGCELPDPSNGEIDITLLEARLI